jgi:O-antigen/teichoic acid export membrane protein
MKNAIRSVAHGVFSRAGLLLINLFAARGLSVHEYGTFGFFLNIVASLSTVAAFGFGVTCNNYVSKFGKTNQEYAAGVVASCFTFSTLLVALVSIICYPFFKTESVSGAVGGEWIAWLLVATLIWLICVAGIGEGALYGAGAYAIILRNSIIIFAISVPAAYFLIKNFGLLGGISSILIFRALFAAGNVGSMQVLGYLRFRKFRRQMMLVRTDIWKILYSLSLPIAMAGLMAGPIIAVGMNIVIGTQGGQREIGLFSWPYQIYLVAIFVPSTLSHFFLSRLSRAEGGRLRSFFVSYIFNFVFSCLVAAGMLFFRGQLLTMAGEAYALAATPIFDKLALCVIFYGASAAFIGFWPAVGKGWMVFWMQICWATILLSTVFFSTSQDGLALSRAFLSAYIFLAVAQPIALLFFWKKDAFVAS